MKSETSNIEILYVEDDPNDAELTLRALRKRNFANRVLHLEDGAQALDYIFGPDGAAQTHGFHPKLILLDLKLPKVDGLEVLRRLKSNERTRAIPVVMLTSSQEDRDLLESYRLGVNSYIVKPIDFDNFSEAVSQLGMYWAILNKAPDVSLS